MSDNNPTTARAQFERIKNHRHTKTIILGAAALGGAFLAIRSSLKQVTSDVHHMAEHVHNLDHNVYLTGTHVVGEIHRQTDHRGSARQHIDEAIASGKDFQYFPGLGVRYKNAADNPSA